MTFPIQNILDAGWRKCTDRCESVDADFSDTMLPEGIEAVHPRYAIDWRNRWMLQRSDFVVIYITHPWGGAGKFAERAKREGKTVVNLFCQ